MARAAAETPPRSADSAPLGAAHCSRIVQKLIVPSFKTGTGNRLNLSTRESLTRNAMVDFKMAKHFTVTGAEALQQGTRLSTAVRRASLRRPDGRESIRITPLSTGRLQLKPTFLEGGPSHGGPLGLIRALWRDPNFTGQLPMWAWIIETERELVLIDTGARPDTTGGITRKKFNVSAQQALVPSSLNSGSCPPISIACC